MGSHWNEWSLRANRDVNTATEVTARSALTMLMKNISADDKRPPIMLSQGDPAIFPCFRTSHVAEQAVVDALQSAKFNSYAPSVGLYPARRAVADYLSKDLTYKISPDDVYITSGGSQAIEVMVTVLASPGANILLPRPGFRNYEARCAFSHLEVRHYDLDPENGWEMNLESVEGLADENTAAIVVINPGNPTGSVFPYQHLLKVAEMARRLGILVIADEVYGHLTFGSTKFVPMATFGSIAPVVTLGSMSKNWAVPGWRLGWLVTTDPSGSLQKSGIAEYIKGCLNISSNPVTFVQAALARILESKDVHFHSKYADTLKKNSDVLYDRIKETPGLTCPRKPEGSVFVMAKLELSELDGIDDDKDFSLKLAAEESVIVLPGNNCGRTLKSFNGATNAALGSENIISAASFYSHSSSYYFFSLHVYCGSMCCECFQVIPCTTQLVFVTFLTVLIMFLYYAAGVYVGLENWLRLNFAVELSILEEGLERVKSFCIRHSKQL